MKPRADIIAPKDGRAFRNIKLAEIPGWLNGRPKDIPSIYFGIRRYWKAWLYKYSRPGMAPGMHMVGQYGMPANGTLSGSGLAQFVLATVIIMQLVVCYKENVHHRFKKYHDYPVSETLMALLPLNFKEHDIGGTVAVKSFAFDALVAGALINAATASKNAPSAAMAARRQHVGFIVLAAAVALIVWNKITFSSKSVDVVDKSDRAALANLLGCEQSEVDSLIKKNEEMKNPLRYSILTNIFVRLYDTVMGSIE